MKKRSLKRFTYPYLEKRVPENIAPGKVLSNRRIKFLLKSKTSRTSITGLPPSKGRGRGLRAADQRALVENKISNRSPGLWLRLMKGTLRLHKNKLGVEKTPWLRIDTLERGSLASIAHPPLKEEFGDGGSPRCGPLSSKVWVKTFHDRIALPLSREEPKNATRVTQLRGTAPLTEGYDSLYSSIQLEQALTRQQERRPSPLLLKLIERNKLRIMYGNMANREVDKLLKRGFSARGGVSDNLFRLLESRIDVFLCRIGFLATIPCARQWIHHGKVLINQKITTTASHMLKPGDVVSLSTSNLARLKESLQERSTKFSLLNRVEPVAFLPSYELPPFKGSDKVKQGTTQLPNKFSKLVRPVSHNNATRLSLYNPAEIAQSLQHVARRERLQCFNLKPTCAEISFRCLTAIYLYPPQQILLPAMVDVEKISRY